MPSDFIPAAIPDGRHEINGQMYMGDGRGGYQPEELIKPQHKLEDEVVRKICAYGIALSDQMRRFKEHTFDDIGNFDALLAQEYGQTVGGAKGNKTLATVDGLFQVKVQVADVLTFGPEIQNAKALFDECLNEWAADAHPALRGIVTDAFQTDRAGNISRARIFMLLRQDVDDPRWKEGQRAIRDAMRTVGSRTYVRCYHRSAHDAPWEAVVLDMAKV